MSSLKVLIKRLMGYLKRRGMPGMSEKNGTLPENDKPNCPPPWRSYLDQAPSKRWFKIFD